MNMPKRDLTALHAWELYSSDLSVEYRQSMEEGKDVSHLKPLMDAVTALPLSEEREELAQVIFRLIQSAPQTPNYAYEEPSELEAIFALRDGYQVRGPKPDLETLRSKLTGAWAGRVCGCLLGKPLEGCRSQGIYGFFRDTGNWPIRRYALSSDMTEALAAKYDVGRKLAETGWYADKLDFAPSDDDTNYTVLGAQIIEKYGRDFRPADVAERWLRLQPKTAYCTAERVAMRNFSLGYLPPDSAIYENPYREWIGAQIRADYFGYINPGDPQTAADMAWRDASISHVKNGIYGEMFVAAMLACAAVTNDTEAVIRGGLGQIPKTSRLYAAIRRILDSWKAGVSQEVCFRDIHQRWDEHNSHDWCHTISNAEIVVACLLYGADYATCIGTAVEQGFDTDCNGATVGSVFGMLHGIDAVGEEWTRPIGGTVDTAIIGVGCTTVEGLVAQMLRHMA